MSLFDDVPGSGPAPRSRSRRGAGTRRGAARGGGPSAGRGASPAEPKGRGVVTVGELTAEISRRLSALGRVAVEGEVGQVKHAGSGHIYFTLKDAGATVACAVWRSRVNPEVRQRLVEGRQVVCHGTIDVYKPRGSYSLIVDRVEPRGMGELLARLEVLKSELRERGYFERRRPLPALPGVVGVVTSRDADALRDFLRTRTLRFRSYPLRLRHTRVQGPGSAAEVARAIADLDASGVDVICVVRGGGSLEDLWTFNELPVAEAIWRCSVPVVSGVGHETDTTLADLVADHRAHTPTNAAEMVLPDRAQLEQSLERAAGYLGRAIDRVLDQRARRLEAVASRPHLVDGARPVRQREETLARLFKRMQVAYRVQGQAGGERLLRASAALARRSPAAWLERSGARLEALAERLPRAAMLARDRRALRLEGTAERMPAGAEGAGTRRAAALDVLERGLHAVSPLAVLGRGYSITRRADGTVLRAADDVAAGAELETLLGSGTVRSKVLDPEGGDAGPKGGSAKKKPRPKKRAASKKATGAKKPDSTEPSSGPDPEQAGPG